MQTASSSPAVLPLSQAWGVRAQARPTQDAFQDVFQGRLAARLASGHRKVSQRERAASSSGSSAVASGLKAHRSRADRETVPRAGLQPQKKRRTPSTQEGKKQRGLRRSQRQSGAEAPISGRAAAARNRAMPALSSNNASTSANSSLTPLLQDVIAFLKTLPDQTLKIPPGRAPQVAALLISAGLPQAEVERLLFSPGSLEKGLSSADLTTAWQRAQGLTPALGTPENSGQSAEGQTMAPEISDLLKNPHYQRLWERLTLPADQLPALRLALTRLGATPENLNRLEQEATDKGLPLARIWEILQNCRKANSLQEAGSPERLAPGDDPSQPKLLGERPVTGEEIAEWQQLLLKAGLKAEVVEKLLGRVSPGSQEALKAALLALAPPEQPPPTVTDPKPLYLPQSLRLTPSFWQSQAKGDRSMGGGGGLGERPHGAGSGQAANPAASLVSEYAGEAMGLPFIITNLQSPAQQVAGAGTPLASTPPAWQLLAPEVRASLWSQIQSGIINNLTPGETKVSLSLNPPELGQIQLSLSLTGQELAVIAVASRPEVAELATLGVQQLLQSLAQQGLILTQFQVQIKDIPVVQPAPVFAGAREKGDNAEPRLPASPRHRSGEVDRFV